jgi:hypothetical protein
MSDKRTGKKKKKLRPLVTEVPSIPQNPPIVPKKTITPAKG